MSEELNENQRKAALLLALGKKVSDVAKEADVAEDTIYRWRKQEKFRQEIEKSGREMRDAIRLRVTDLLNNSLDSLTHELKRHNNTGSLRQGRLALDVIKTFGSNLLAEPQTETPLVVTS